MVSERRALDLAAKEGVKLKDLEDRLVEFEAALAETAAAKEPP